MTYKKSAPDFLETLELTFVISLLSIFSAVCLCGSSTTV